MQNLVQGGEIETQTVTAELYLFGDDASADIPYHDDHKLPNPLFRSRNKLVEKATVYSSIIHKVVVATIIAAYAVYFGIALDNGWENSRALVIMTAVVIAFLAYIYIRDHWGKGIYNCSMRPIVNAYNDNWHILKWFFFPIVALLILLYLVIFVIEEVQQVQSLIGLCFFFLVTWITCKHPDQINWRPVFWGMAIQFIMGILVLRWKVGYNVVKFVSDQVNTFLEYSLYGASEVFGDPYFLFHPFAFVVLPLVVFLAAFTTSMYHLGITQVIIKKVGWLFEITMQTTAIESVSLIANIFMSVLDSMLLLKPYFKRLTDSEFFCFLVGTHSTIAGFAFILFIWMGSSPQHLLTSAVMSAPAAVAMSKLSYPETEKSYYKNIRNLEMEKGGHRTIWEAAAAGAWDAGKGTMAIIVQIIAFVGLISFVDATLMWIGDMVDIELTLRVIFGYMFMPVAWIIGVEWADCKTVGSMMGIKLFTNELLGFLDLGTITKDPSAIDVFLPTVDQISDRSAMLATYAMCGFSSFGTMYMFAGVWSTIEPERTSQVVQLIPRIMMCTNFACYMTACIAGLFYTDELLERITYPSNSGFVLFFVEGLPSMRSLMGLAL